MALDRAKTKANVDKFLRANRIQDAIRELQKLAEDNPRDIQTLNQIGNLYLRLGNKAAAVPMFIKVAELFAKDGFHMKAVASLKIATREEPENLQAWEMLGSLSEQQGFTKEARLAYDQVARLVSAAGNLDGLVRIQRKILDLEPENIKIRVQVGDNLLKLGKTQEGAKEYLKAAQQLVRQGLFKEAARLFERAAELSPENLRMLESLLRKMFSSQQHEQALEILGALLERHPEAETLVLLKVDALTEMQRAEEAEGLCLKLLAEKPDAAAAQGRLVRLLVGARRFDEAFGLLRKWVQSCDPARLQETEAMVREVLAHAPENLEGLRAVVDVARRSGERQRLLEALSRLASAAEEIRNPSAAREAVQEMVEVDPLNPLYRERLERLQAGSHPPPARAAAAPRPAPPPPPPVEEPPAAEETGELEIEIEVEDLQLGSAEVTASLPSGARVEVSPPEGAPPAGALSAPGFEEAAETEGAKAPPETRKLSPREAEAIKEQLTEAEVFLKYGFADKAIAELNAVLKKVPDHVHAHQKLISVYRKQKKTDKAVRQILKLAQIFADQGDHETRDNLVEEARALDPNSEALKAFLEPERAAPKPGELDLELLLPPVPQEAPPAVPEEVEIALDEGVSAPLSAEPPVELLAEEGGPPEGEAEAAAEPAAEVLFPAALSEAEAVPPEAPPVLEEAGAELLRLEIPEGETRARAELADKLEEAEFYLSQELFGEARRALEELEASWPEDPKVRDFRSRLQAAGQAPLRPFEGEAEAASPGGEAEAAPAPLAEEAPPAAEEPVSASAEALFEEAEPSRAEEALPVLEEPGEPPAAEEAGEAAPAPPAPAPRRRTKLKVSLEELLPAEILERDQKAFGAEKPKDEFLELANELGAALDGLQSPEEELFEEPAKSPEEMSFAEVFEEFKKGVEKKVGEEDFATHYNLGIAYKEMELLDEAIGEFQMAARSPQFFVECCSMLGLCFRQKGLSELAEKWYRKGLEAPGFPEEVMAGLRYDLAETLEEMGRKEEALALFREVYAVNAQYRDVKSKIQNLS